MADILALRMTAFEFTTAAAKKIGGRREVNALHQTD
jgi:hypothetical protein